LNDLWKFDGTYWTWIAGDDTTGNYANYGTKGESGGYPGGLYGSFYWTDKNFNFWFFGGYGADSNNYVVGLLNDIWMFNGQNWTWISGNGTIDSGSDFGTKGIPSTTSTPGGVYDTVGWVDTFGNFWLFGGYGINSTNTADQGYLNNLWKFNVNTSEWVWLDGLQYIDYGGTYGSLGEMSSSYYPSSCAEGYNWVAPGNMFWMFGGFGYGSFSSSSVYPGYLNALWALDPHCDAGTFSSDGLIPCTNCLPGTYENGTGATECSKCPPGTYSTQIGASSSSTCKECSEGTYSTQSGSSTCQSCPAGTYSNISGANSSSMCNSCPAGTYSTQSDAKSSSTCTACLEGTYSTQVGADNSSTCQSCPAGTYSNISGANSSSTCNSCPAGTYSTQSGAKSSSTCTACLEGTYSTQVGADNSSTCQSCPAGTYSNISGANSSSTCKPCPLGTYSTLERASSSSTCTPCPAGTYSSKLGSSYCPSNASSTNTSSKPISTSSISTSSIAGIVIGTLVLVGMVAVASIIFLKYKRKLYSNHGNSIEISSLPSLRSSWIEKYSKIYEIQVFNKIGGGNFGEVYYGRWNGTTEVALKQLKASEHFEEFVQEASMLQSLNHPNIVRFFGIHTTPNGEHFLVMEYIRKGSLEEVLQIEKNQIFLLDLLSI